MLWNAFSCAFLPLSSDAVGVWLAGMTLSLAFGGHRPGGCRSTQCSLAGWPWGAAVFSVVIGCSPTDFCLARLPFPGPVAGEQAFGGLSRFFLYPSVLLTAVSSAPPPGCLGQTETPRTQHWGPRSVCPVLSALILLAFGSRLTARVLVVLTQQETRGGHV